ncbi:MAG: 2-polyprenyl-3-methyl-6-methoxy-1,4-benzoquinone monooxygenase [Woeseia sp.]|nr:2-polyprenyl-3-methyl-6-methoxy-1,4-benzoquinone monooxygenase [Woeseia sp.]
MKNGCGVYRQTARIRYNKIVTNRKLSPLDRFLAGANDALRTVAAPAGHAARANPAAAVTGGELDSKQRSHAAGLMRVNHAGEVAAQALYKGHAAVARDTDIEHQMQQAADEEFDHLAWCEQRIHELGESPSRLSPVWYAGAFAIGAASGILGDKWSLGFIAETERQVCAHLDSHLEGLPQEDSRSRAIVKQMRDEEQQHGENAVAAGAAQLPTPVKRLMQLTAGIMTRTAYWV